MYAAHTNFEAYRKSRKLQIRVPGSQISDFSSGLFGRLIRWMSLRQHNSYNMIWLYLVRSNIIVNPDHLFSTRCCRCWDAQCSGCGSNVFSRRDSCGIKWLNITRTQFMYYVGKRFLNAIRVQPMHIYVTTAECVHMWWWSLGTGPKLVGQGERVTRE